MVGQAGTVSRRALLAAGSAASLGVRRSVAQSSSPVRVGVLNSFSKSFALLGESNLNGMTLAFEAADWQVAGRKIELLREDDEISPQVGLQKIRKLVEGENVDFVCGPQGSNVALAVLTYMKQRKPILIITGAGQSSLTHDPAPNVFRTSLSAWQISSTMADWVYANLAKEVFLSASDFAGGRSPIDEFRAVWLKLGGKVVGEVYPPLGTTDFSPYLASIRESGATATYNFYAGTDAARFVNQFAELGLKGTIKLTGYAALVDNDTLPAQGKNALGCITGNIYSQTLDNAANADFSAAYLKKYGVKPNLYSEYGYTAAHVILAALQATGGDTTDKAKLSSAIEAVKFDAPRGPFRFDPKTHNPIQNVYILEAVEQGGNVVNVVRHTVSDVRDPGKAS